MASVTQRAGVCAGSRAMHGCPCGSATWMEIGTRNGISSDRCYSMYMNMYICFTVYIYIYIHSIYNIEFCIKLFHDTYTHTYIHTYIHTDILLVYSHTHICI